MLFRSLDMVRSYSFDSHFESGLGIAVKGEMPEGPVTIVKVSGDMSRTFCHGAELKANLSERSLCRTQIILRLDGDGKKVCKEYFLTAMTDGCLDLQTDIAQERTR